MDNIRFAVHVDWNRKLRLIIGPWFESPNVEKIILSLVFNRHGLHFEIENRKRRHTSEKEEFSLIPELCVTNFLREDTENLDFFQNLKNDLKRYMNGFIGTFCHHY